MPVVVICTIWVSHSAAKLLLEQTGTERIVTQPHKDIYQSLTFLVILVLQLF